MSEKISKQGRHLRKYIRNRIRSLGLNYKLLATDLGVSELKLKRQMTQQDFKLDFLIRLLDRLGHSFFQFLDLNLGLAPQLQMYTLAQEKLLTEQPRLGLFFLKIRFGFSIDEAAKVAGIPKLKIPNSLRRLENVNLLELHPDLKTKIKIVRPSLFHPRGAFRKIQLPQFSRGLIDHFYNLAQQNGFNLSRPKTIFIPFEVYLNESMGRSLCAELAQVVTKYRELSVSLDQKNDPLTPFAGLVACDNFDGWRASYEALIARLESEQTID